MTRATLSHRPLIQTRRAHAPGIKRVPNVTALTHPKVVFRGLPTAERTSNAWLRRSLLSLIGDLGFALEDGRQAVLGFGSVFHFPVLCPFDQILTHHLTASKMAVSPARSTDI